ncbi:MAG: methyltransferase domain-containing protein [Vulcanimicrobiaceae bacterium]
MSEPGHPLAVRLAEHFRDRPTAARVLVLGVGNGRNLPPLLAAGLIVDAIDDDPERVAAVRERFGDEPRLRVARADYPNPAALGRDYDGAVSSSAYLHGTPAKVRAALAALCLIARPGARLLFTLGSKSDSRFGLGSWIDDDTWAPIAGPETGVPHSYFDERDVRALLTAVDVVDLDERDVAAVVGRWAHVDDPRPPQVHWFVEALTRACR